MIAIACATDDERAFRAGAAHVIEALDEGNSLLLRRHRYDSIDVPCNEMLDTAMSCTDLEAIVLVHQDAFVADGQGDAVMTLIRGLLDGNPDLAVADAVADGPVRETTTVSGTLLVLSIWAARSLRFDPALGGSAAASVQDLSLQALAAGRRVLAAPLGVVRTEQVEGHAPSEDHLDSMAELRQKWGPSWR